MRKPRAKDELRNLDVRPSKSRGQNFTIDASVIESIVAFGAPSAADNLVEIGPGLGALTERLAQVGPLKAIEIEPNLAAHIEARFSNVSVVQADVRTVDFKSLGSQLVVFGNLPYSFSTDIVFHLLDQRQHVKRAVLLLQKEFVDRLAAAPGGKEYGSLSVAVQLWCDIEAGPIVDGRSFHPPASVMSRVVKLSFLPESRVPVADFVWFERVVRAAFHQRRKMLHNTLLSIGSSVTKESIAEALSEAGIDPKRRAETVTLDEFSRLSRALRPMAGQPA